MLLVELAGQLQSQSIFRLNSSDKDQKSSLFLLDILLQGWQEDGGFLWENVLIGSQMYPLCEHMWLGEREEKSEHCQSVPVKFLTWEREDC